MKQSKILFVSFWVGLTLFWLVSPSALPSDLNFFAIRHSLTDYSGIIAMGAMSVAMILAGRFAWVEPWLNGLDKSYRLHKWLGIAALCASVLHWVVVSSPKWAIDLGLMERPERRGPPPGAAEGAGAGGLEDLLGSLREPAEMVGEWGFYIAVLLMGLALIKVFPYKQFFKTHYLLGIIYLVLVFHAVILFPFDAWLHPIGLLSGALMIGGVVSAVRILLGMHGKAREAGGKIVDLQHKPSANLLSTTIRVDDKWQGHKAGQFAFVTFDRKEGKHPFTMASSWNGETREITFLSKSLGDYTSLMPHSLHEGDNVTIEGPYGRFTFDDDKERQIWVGAGIGITPFIARMQAMIDQSQKQAVDLFHVTAFLDPDLEKQLKSEAEAAGINLHLIVDQKGKIFTDETVRSAISDWKHASLWFCGPAAMGRTLQHKLESQGFASGQFHQEMFEMR